MTRVVIIISIVLYCIGIVLCATTSDLNVKCGNTQNKMILSLNFTTILDNNLRVTLLLLLGAFLFGTTTVLNLIYNGLYTALIIRNSFSNGINPLSVVLLVLPHGIFEIPAIIIAGAAGFKIPYEIVRYLAGKKEQILTKDDIKEYLTLALISIILIVIAAWIEANVTLKIAKAMLNSTKGI